MHAFFAFTSAGMTRLLCALFLCNATLAMAQMPTPRDQPVEARNIATVTIAMVLPREEQNIEEAFKAYLQHQGLSVHYIPIRFSGRAEDAGRLRQEVRDAHPDLIYSWGTPTTLALAGKVDGPAGDAIRDIPIVFTEVTDPVGAGLMRSLDHHESNVTGVSHVAPLPVQLNAIRSYRPFSRLGYLHNPAEPNSALVRAQLQQLAAQQKFEVESADIPLDARGEPDVQALPALIRRMAERKVDFLYIGPSTLLAFTHRDLVTGAALQARLPTFCATESIVRRSGCMFGLFSNGANTGRYAAAKALQILVQHIPAQRIPASTLQRFSLLINMRTAQSLDLYPPMLLLNIAEVIGLGPNPLRLGMAPR
ncbi:ABC transporter substrate-binding protein [Herbaspirillum huttiense F1]|uniref:ABC transporter substrate-binding protein n=1 Tax=Herbaspirillum huttiense subsp. lycopersici TaxID=3074428 RepID=A0ABU2EI03_9BURK|nr:MULTISPECIES: ABC transporter substrate-binding protein [Herbaspirillum]MBP1313737.1 putative ABC transport system substrate-binding protein [Herbaspirillum sp. 1130]MDR6738926.1 putative ABC transport system substrate-binding protein [Herbaspirillum sp. 1173]MDR9847518.1 ABC transporter substrate-binding protein [Herbaspirillum huttiense SE1]MDT0354991.1 ABC transporter substrate-binding protein [Herbaspirillum huttiense F1]